MADGQESRRPIAGQTKAVRESISCLLFRPVQLFSNVAKAEAADAGSIIKVRGRKPERPGTAFKPLDYHSFSSSQRFAAGGFYSERDAGSYFLRRPGVKLSPELFSQELTRAADAYDRRPRPGAE